MKARRPSLRWHIAWTRWRLAVWLVQAERAPLWQAFALVAVVLAGSVLNQAPHVLVPARTQGAWLVWVIQIAIMVLAALISMALRPKPKDPEKVKFSVPPAEDGKGIIDVFGTVWIDDSNMLAWKQMGTTKIKSKAGKKG